MTADTFRPTQRQDCIIGGRALIANGYQPGFAPYSPAFFRHLPDRFDHPPFPITMLACLIAKTSEVFEDFRSLKSPRRLEHSWTRSKTAFWPKAKTWGAESSRGMDSLTIRWTRS